MNGGASARPQISLLVLYCSDLPLCHDFYQKLGLTFKRERHDAGPEHYASVLESGAVFELYPAGSGVATGRTRVGLIVSKASLQIPLPPGCHVLRDPDGRVVDLQINP